MDAFTPKEHVHYKEFVDLHSNEVAEYILRHGHVFTTESISKLGNIVAKNAFMNFTDYDENCKLETADSLVVFYFDYIDDNIEFNKLYDFFEQNLSYCLGKLVETNKQKI